MKEQLTDRSTEKLRHWHPIAHESGQCFCCIRRVVKVFVGVTLNVDACAQEFLGQLLTMLFRGYDQHRMTNKKAGRDHSR